MTLKLKKINDYLYELPQHDEMRVPGLIYGDQEIIRHLEEDVERGKEWNALVQIYNVACLPGIQKASLAMSDVHPGYGFPIGGVGAFNLEEGIIAVGGIGFDINCGVRTVLTPLTRQDLENEEAKRKLANQLARDIPAGVGSTGELKLSLQEIDRVLVKGAEYAVEQGYGSKDDLEYTEENGRVAGADPTNVSLKAKERQFKQVGTLGSGNHYLEVQYVDEVYEEKAAQIFGLVKDRVVISIHCGSRALGHQIGTDYLKILESASKKYHIPIRDKELVCAPIKSQEGEQYLSAVKAGINCAFANRQVLTHLVRTSLKHALGVQENQVKVLYDVGHNNVKIEIHRLTQMRTLINTDVNDMVKLLVHRKGATRAFGPGREEVPAKYRDIGQPVIIGGTMGTESYILHGTEKGMSETFGSACHGAGRALSRVQAKKKWYGKELVKELEKQGIIIRGVSMSGLAEEAPGAYKDVREVVEVMHAAGIVEKVVRLKPMICVKG